MEQPVSKFGYELIDVVDGAIVAAFEKLFGAEAREFVVRRLIREVPSTTYSEILSAAVLNDWYKGLSLGFMLSENEEQHEALVKMLDTGTVPAEPQLLAYAIDAVRDYFLSLAQAMARTTASREEHVEKLRDSTKAA